MALETGSYPSDFVLTNPTSGDPKSQGDDHLRLIKTFVQAALPIGAPVYPLTSGTTVATTSGTSIDFTSIPSWVKRITLSFVGVSVSGTSSPLIQLGDSGGVEATGYLGAGAGGANAASPGVTAYTTGFGVNSSAAANVLHGAVVLTLVDAATFTWAASGVLSNSQTAAYITVSGSKSLSATLDRIRLTTVNGTDTFDAGKVNILYE
jgi:hypothetical protein